MSDLDLLAASGITGRDAETALRSLYRKLLALGKRISDFETWSPDRLMRIFGSDAGRAAIVLTR